MLSNTMQAVGFNLEKITRPKLKMEMLEQGVKYVQSLKLSQWKT